MKGIISFIKQQIVKMKPLQKKDIILMIMIIFIKNVILVAKHVINIVIQKIQDVNHVIMI